ncbi:protein disulfide isomerase-like 1-6 [Apium graveolens]|uniref:protein disulfide isomerase-like 1-6 n=1 Tax=Apium graveolens TaxID=4045 RepID=UPI003D7ACE33
MYTSKPTSRFIFFAIFLTLLLTFSITVLSDDVDDMEGLDELLAIDEEEQDHVQSSETDVLSRAQRVVLELNAENSKKVIDENENVLVLGYAPWCVKSAELMPHFAEAAMSLRELGSKILMAKIDAERYPKAASVLGIKGFPTLLLFVNATSQPYNAGLTSEEIVTWARKKTGVPVVRVSSGTEASEFIKKHSVYAVGFFEKFEGPDYEEFVKAATSDNEIQFAETSSSEVARILFPDIKATSHILGLVKSEPEKFTTFENAFKVDNILQFLDDNKFPLVTLLTEINSARVYSSSNKLQVYVFSDFDELKSLIEPLQNIARKFKSQIMFIHVDIKVENLAKPFLTLFGLENSEDTVVTAFDYKHGSKYLLEDPTPAKIEDFCLGILDGTVSPFYKSQPIPDNEEANILTIVGKTFDSLVLDSNKNVFLEVHAPWCFSCETTSKQVGKLAKHFMGLETLTFARIDASANEHPRLQVNDYPTLLFYPAEDKTNPISLPTKSNLKDLAKLINKYCKSHAKDEL